MKKPTLAWSLIIRVAPTSLLALVVIGALAFQSATYEINRIYDAQLITDANTLWSLLQNYILKHDFNPPRQFNDPDLTMGDQMALNTNLRDFADARMFRVWKGHHLSIISASAFSPDQAMSVLGLSTALYDGEPWRVYTLKISTAPIVIEVAEKTMLRRHLVAKILLNLILPLIVLIPIITVLIWIGIQKGLGAVHGFVRQIRNRFPDDLSLITTETLPRDLLPFGESVNLLLSKLDRSLTAERQFADHVAHQLRTPQASLRLLLQMLQQAEQEEERTMILNNLVRSNDKALRLIEQLLQSGRVNHQDLTISPVNLYDVAASILAELGETIRSKAQDVVLSGCENAWVDTDEALLRLLFENIFENAVKYSPTSGRVQVLIGGAGDNTWLVQVCDTGPGIPAHQAEAVFQRFFRIPGSKRPEGTGLGLTIAADAAKRLSAAIALGVPAYGYGLRADIRIPASDEGF